MGVPWELYRYWSHGQRMLQRREKRIKRSPSCLAARMIHTLHCCAHKMRKNVVSSDTLHLIQYDPFVNVFTTKCVC